MKGLYHTDLEGLLATVALCWPREYFPNIDPEMVAEKQQGATI